MSEFPVKEYFKQTVVFEEGEVGDKAYVLKKGRVEISKRTPAGRRVVAVIDAVSIFGEMALISDDYKRTATARALDMIEVIEIDKKKFDKLVGATPGIIGMVMKTLAKRLADETEKG